MFGHITAHDSFQIGISSIIFCSNFQEISPIELLFPTSNVIEIHSLSYSSRRVNSSFNFVDTVTCSFAVESEFIRLSHFICYNSGTKQRKSESYCFQFAMQNIDISEIVITYSSFVSNDSGFLLSSKNFRAQIADISYCLFSSNSVLSIFDLSSEYLKIILNCSFVNNTISGAFFNNQPELPSPFTLTSVLTFKTPLRKCHFNFDVINDFIEQSFCTEITPIIPQDIQKEVQNIILDSTPPNFLILRNR
jgi:hypothetical protein